MLLYESKSSLRPLLGFLDSKLGALVFAFNSFPCNPALQLLFKFYFWYYFFFFFFTVFLLLFFHF